MPSTISPEHLEILRDYSAGKLGTRSTIERFGMHDYADLVVALAQHDLAFPGPVRSAALDVALDRATAILQPRLRRGR